MYGKQLIPVVMRCVRCSCMAWELFIARLFWIAEKTAGRLILPGDGRQVAMQSHINDR